MSYVNTSISVTKFMRNILQPMYVQDIPNIVHFASIPNITRETKKKELFSISNLNNFEVTSNKKQRAFLH